MFNFEKLEVWEKSIDFADFIHLITRAFPDDERFGLTSQIRRAAISISSNIAEGTSRLTKDDYARFLEIATGSVFEVVSQLFIAQKRNYLSDQDHQRLYVAAEEQSRMLSGRRRSPGFA